MKKIIFSISLFLFCFGATRAHAQNIDPRQINWANSTGCSTVGSPYIPQSNTCVALGAVLTSPSGAQTITQPSAALPLSVNYFAPMFVNGVVQAAKFCGSGTIGGVTLHACTVDACVKLRDANQYATNQGGGKVDVSGFQGTQSCSVDPLGNLNATVGQAIFLEDDFGWTHFQTTAGWTITNSGVKLKGAGGWNTQVEYTGTNCTATPTTCAVLSVNTHAGGGTPASRVDLTEQMSLTCFSTGICVFINVAVNPPEASRSIMSTVRALGRHKL